MKLLVFLIFAIGVAHADETNLKELAKKLNCEATLTGANSTELYCFRNDVIDPGQQTETRGCSIRRYDLEKKEFIGFPNRSEKNQFVLCWADEFLYNA